VTDQQAQTPFGSIAAPATPAPGAGTAPAAATRGNIAENIFAEVEQMTSGGTMNRSEAFEEISKRTGRRAGTVAANYYRIARKRGTVAPRRTRGAGRPAGSGSTAGGNAAAIIARLEAATKDMADLLRTQEAEIARLREQSEQFEKLRQWMAKNA
jgi:hypothetical protein